MTAKTPVFEWAKEGTNLRTIPAGTGRCSESQNPLTSVVTLNRVFSHLRAVNGSLTSLQFCTSLTLRTCTPNNRVFWGDRWDGFELRTAPSSLPQHSDKAFHRCAGASESWGSPCRRRLCCSGRTDKRSRAVPDGAWCAYLTISGDCKFCHTLRGGRRRF